MGTSGASQRGARGGLTEGRERRRSGSRAHRALATLGAVVALAGLAAGCGDDSGAAASTTAASASSTTVAPTSTSTTSTSTTTTSTTTTTTPGAPPSSIDLVAARAYCVEKGGTVQDRRAYFGTNDDRDAWLQLGGEIELCRFQTLGDEADSRIYVDLVSLYSEEPTLASVAYLAKRPMEGGTGGGNPATANCAHLGGSSAFGSGASGGGWVAEDDPIDVVVALCVFPDMSAIDEWGIAYHSDGTIRGIDLTPVFRYQPGADLPNIFG